MNNLLKVNPNVNGQMAGYMEQKIFLSPENDVGDRIEFNY